MPDDACCFFSSKNRLICSGGLSEVNLPMEVNANGLDKLPNLNDRPPCSFTSSLAGRLSSGVPFTSENIDADKECLSSWKKSASGYLSRKKCCKSNWKSTFHCLLIPAPYHQRAILHSRVIVQYCHAIKFFLLARTAKYRSHAYRHQDNQIHYCEKITVKPILPIKLGRSSGF